MMVCLCGVCDGVPYALHGVTVSLLVPFRRLQFGGWCITDGNGREQFSSNDFAILLDLGEAIREAFRVPRGGAGNILLAQDGTPRLTDFGLAPLPATIPRPATSMVLRSRRQSVRLASAASQSAPPWPPR